MSPLSCDRVRALLSDTLDGTLFADEVEQAVVTHLESCGACGRSARELSSIHRLILEDRAADLLHHEKASRKESGPVLASPRSGGRRWVIAGSVAAALALALGMVFRLGKSPDVVGSLLEVAGQAYRIQREGETPASRNMDLHSGEGLRTEGPGSQATLAFRDGTRLDVGEDTTLHRIEEGPDGKRVSLAKGSLRAYVAHQEARRPMRFTTPQGEAKVVGTSLRLFADADPQTGTRLEVTEGKVELRNPAGHTVIVESGHFAVSAKGVELVSQKLESAWQNVTAGLGGETWGFGGIHTFVAVPGRDQILAGISNSWIWSTADGGQTWSPMGNAGQGPILNRPHQILFDPKDPRIFWVSGIYGPGIFRTTDGGTTFRRLGTLEHIDGLAVDFSDPLRRTLLASHHLH
ncbi:MAG TPA: FecR domain-containing protein, partial [Planctomycetota bacterium]|nr:FecR domain-containing protein [Planctomycetota bacterium]